MDKTNFFRRHPVLGGFWTLLAFLVVFLPQWFSSVWSLGSSKPLLQYLQEDMRMSLPSFSPYWVTIPIALFMFWILILELRRGNRGAGISKKQESESLGDGVIESDFSQLNKTDRLILQHILYKGSVTERQLIDYLKSRQLLSYDGAYEPIENRTLFVTKSFAGFLKIAPQFKKQLQQLLTKPSLSGNNSQQGEQREMGPPEPHIEQHSVGDHSHNIVGNVGHLGDVITINKPVESEPLLSLRQKKFQEKLNGLNKLEKEILYHLVLSGRMLRSEEDRYIRASGADIRAGTVLLRIANKTQLISDSQAGYFEMNPEMKRFLEPWAKAGGKLEGEKLEKRMIQDDLSNFIRAGSILRDCIHRVMDFYQTSSEAEKWQFKVESYLIDHELLGTRYATRFSCAGPFLRGVDVTEENIDKKLQMLDKFIVELND